MKPSPGRRFYEGLVISVLASLAIAALVLVGVAALYGAFKVWNG